MEIADVVSSILQYKKQCNSSEFLSKMYDFFSKQKYVIITHISDDEILLAGILLTLFTSEIMYHVYLIPENEAKIIPDNTSTREIKLSKLQSYNLHNQIYGIKNKSLKICNKLQPKYNDFIAVISRMPISYEEAPKEIWGIIFGIHALYFLDHQNLDRYCSPMILKHTMPGFDQIMRYKHIIETFPKERLYRMMIFSGLLYQFLGTSYSQDTDILMLAHSEAEKEIIRKELGGFDLILITEPVIKNNMSKDTSYLNDHFFTRLPQSVGASNLQEVVLNPKYHFYYVGIKCLCLDINYKRSISRSHPFSFIDLFLLKMFNKINAIQEACIKNISIRSGKAVVTNSKTLDYFYVTMKKYLKEWYTMDVSINELKSHFIKCEEKYDTIYSEKSLHVDTFIKTQIEIHRRVSQVYIRKYATNIDYLLDIGCGKLTGSYLYDQLHIKNVYGIEPSIYSINTANLNAKKYKNINFVIQQGYGDKPFDFGKKFDVITFIFTIHYMMANLNIVMDNLINASKSGTKVILTFVNGNKIKPLLQKNDRYEIRHNNDIYWGVYRYNHSNKPLFFMKDVYGLQNGSEEYLVDSDILISVFEKNKFKLIEKKTFDKEVSSNNAFKKYKLLPFQEEILSFQELLIFSKI